MSLPACPLPRLPTYQLTALAVIVFIIGHFGSDFMQQVPALGQLKFPIIFWFFQLGYNSGWKAQPILWWGLVILTSVTVFVGHVFFPLGVLATMIAVKYLLDPLMDISMKHWSIFVIIQLALLLLSPVTHYYVTEYGTLALILATSGWLVRHRDVMPKGRTLAGWHLAFTAAAFALFQFMCLPNMKYVSVIMAACGLLTAWYMWDFKDSIMIAIRKKPEGVIDRIAFFMGHRSLEIFVIHLLLFKLVAWYMYA